MAEEYLVGSNRIVYRSTSFEENLKVFVDLYCPDGLREPSIVLVEMELGLYYFRCNFSKVGVYTGIFYEDGVKKISQNFRITEGTCTDIGYGGLKPFLGNNVINT